MEPFIDFQSVLATFHEKAEQIADANRAISMSNWDYFILDRQREDMLIASLKYIPTHVLHSHVDTDSMFDFLIKHEMMDPIYYLITKAGIIPLNNIDHKDSLITCVVRSSRFGVDMGSGLSEEEEDELKTKRGVAVYECVRFLIERGYIPYNWPDLLMIATAYDCEPVMALIASYIPVDANTHMLHYPTAVVFRAVRYNTRNLDIIKEFLAIGGVVNTNADREDSLLHIALDHVSGWRGPDQERYDLVRILLEAGADWKKPDNMGNTPLHIVVHSSHMHCLQLLQWDRAHGGTDLFIHTANDLNETALDTLPRPRMRWMSSSSPDFNLLDYFDRCAQVIISAELLMALGARVSHKVVIMLRLIVPRDRTPRVTRFGEVTPGPIAARVADTALWLYERQRAMDQFTTDLPAELAAMVTKHSSGVFDDIHSERFTQAMEWLNEPSDFSQEALDLANAEQEDDLTGDEQEDEALAGAAEFLDGI
jgi:Ankyrin repeats (many copies)